MTPLQTELTTDPLGLGYAPLIASGNDGAIAAILNDKSRGYTMIRPRLVSARAVLAEYAEGPMAAANVLDKLEQAAAANNAVKWAFFFLKADGLDVGAQATQAMLDQLAVGGVLTVAESVNLKSLALVPASRAEVLGLGEITTQMVAEARTA